MSKVFGAPDRAGSGVKLRGGTELSRKLEVSLISMKSELVSAACLYLSCEGNMLLQSQLRTNHSSCYMMPGRGNLTFFRSWF